MIKDAVDAGSDTARRDLAEHHVDQDGAAAGGGERVVGGVDRARGGAGREDAEHRRRPRAELRLLALHRAAGQPGGLRVATGLGPRRDGQRRTDHHRHGAEDRQALLAAAQHRPDRAGQADRDDEDQEHLEQVAERVGVLEGVRRVGVEEAAAVGAELLDGLLAGDGTAGDDLRPAGDRVDRVVGEVLDRTERHQQDRRDEGDRQQDAERRAHEVDPEVAEVVRRGCA